MENNPESISDSFLKSLAIESGQRKYGPPADWEGDVPGKGCEIFIAKLMRDTSDAEVWQLVRRVGSVYEMRVMTEPGGRNRGYAFVVYADKDTAKAAVQQLHNECVRGQRIGATISVDNRRLFVGGLPRDKNRADVLLELRAALPDLVPVPDPVNARVRYCPLVDVIMYPSAHDKSKNRGFAFIELPSHRAAALVPLADTVKCPAICVDWAEPELDVDEDTMKQVRILYLRNLMLSTTEETLWHLFDSFAPGTVERIKKIKDFAFVHFQTREAAETALQKAQGMEIDTASPEVMWARPPDRSFMRHVRDTMRSASGKQAVLPVASNIHQGAGLPQSIVLAAAAAATHQHNKQAAPAATAAALLDHQRHMMHSAAGAESEAAMLWAYCGVPLIELPDSDDTAVDSRHSITSTRSVAGSKRSACRTGREQGSGQRKRAIAAVSYGPGGPTFLQPLIAGQGALPVPVATALLTPYQMANLVPSVTLPHQTTAFAPHFGLLQQRHPAPFQLHQNFVTPVTIDNQPRQEQILSRVNAQLT